LFTEDGEDGGKGFDEGDLDLACELGVPRLEIIFEEAMQLAAGIERVNLCSKYGI
jgi:hypothetical protein